MPCLAPLPGNCDYIATMPGRDGCPTRTNDMPVDQECQGRRRWLTARGCRSHKQPADWPGSAHVTPNG
jgi:hypothetical protein